MLPPFYIPVLTPELIRRYLPGLILGTNFRFTSENTDEYNCTAWAFGATKEWKQFYDETGTCDIRVDTYIDFFKSIGFEESSEINVEIGANKIAIYTDGNIFTHIARQLPNGKWTSKLGEWEDIEHDTLDVLSGKFFGKPTVYMKRKI